MGRSPELLVDMFGGDVKRDPEIETPDTYVKSPDVPRISVKQKRLGRKVKTLHCSTAFVCSIFETSVGKH